MPIGIRKKQAIIFGGIGLLLAAIGVIVSLVLLNQPQDTRQKAAVEGGTAKVRITPSTATLQPGASSTATVSFTTEGTLIQGLAVQLSYTYTGSTPPLVLSNLKMEPTLEASGKFSCALKEIVGTASPVTLNFACTAISGYSSTSFADLFTFTITAGPDGTDAPVPLMFNTQRTIIASGGEDIAAIPTGNLVITLPKPAAASQKKMDIRYSARCNPSELEVSAVLTDANNQPLTNTNVKFSFNNQVVEQTTNASGRSQATMTYSTAGSYPLVINATGYSEQRSNIEISSCPAATAAATASPDPTTSTSATATPNTSNHTVSCNGSCTTSSNCVSGLTCYSGRCRKSTCQSDTSCQCSSSNVASTSGTTELPVTGSFDRTLAMLLIGGLLAVGGVQVLLGRQSQVESDVSETEM